MTITWLCLFWLFFFYSFIGWCIEVCAAAVQHRKFVNRGFVAGPLCPIYGFGAMWLCTGFPAGIFHRHVLRKGL